MSTETLTKSPLEESEGLNTEQRKKQLELARHRSIMHAVSERSHASNDVYRGVFLGSIARAIDRGADTLGTKHADTMATKHYRANEAAYQIQAVKDAANEGVRTNFGEK